MELKADQVEKLCRRQSFSFTVKAKFSHLGNVSKNKNKQGVEVIFVNFAKGKAKFLFLYQDRFSADGAAATQRRCSSVTMTKREANGS